LTRSRGRYEAAFDHDSCATTSIAEFPNPHGVGDELARFFRIKVTNRKQFT
jgi:hypothetical protein